MSSRSYTPLVAYMKWHHSLAVVFLVVLLCSCSRKSDTMLSGVNILPVGTSVEQGLSVYYRYVFYRHLNQMASESVMLTEGEKGQPVPMLDHQFEGNVYDSKRAKGVAVFLTGLIRMESSGTYRFKAMSNDGIQVAVNGEVVVFDPAIHGDRFSKIGAISVAGPGWYPLTVKYFQRKGTARLTLYWQPPGAKDFEVVPAGVYGHQLLPFEEKKERGV